MYKSTSGGPSGGDGPDEPGSGWNSFYEWSGYDPFIISDQPEYSGNDPFKIPETSSFSGYDPFSDWLNPDNGGTGKNPFNALLELIKGFGDPFEKVSR